MYDLNWYNEAVKYWQSALETTMGNVGKFQEQGTKFIHTLVENGKVLQEENTKIVNEWMKMIQNWQQESTKYVMENVTKASDFIQPKKTTPPTKGK